MSSNSSIDSTEQEQEQEEQDKEKSSSSSSSSSINIAEKRIPCPLDPNHNINPKNLEKHLKKTALTPRLPKSGTY